MNAQRPARAPLVVAAILAGLSGLVLWDAATLAVASYYGIGPKAMPWLVAAALGALAVGHVIVAFRGTMPVGEPYDLTAVLLVLGGFVALIAAISFGLGFIPAAAIVFTAVSTAFGRRNLVADGLLGLALGTASYALFVLALTLSLPEGPVERLLRQIVAG